MPEYVEPVQTHYICTCIGLSRCLKWLSDWLIEQYSGALLIWPLTGQRNLAILMGWAVLTG